jgi:L-aminopeptidase/D-esterase-like protein
MMLGHRGLRIAQLRIHCSKPTADHQLGGGSTQEFLLPVVAETYDGWLSEIQSYPLTIEHAFAAFDSATGGQPNLRR